MPRETKKRVLFKKEDERSKTEKLIRDLVCYGVVIYAAIMGFLVVNANVNLANAQAAYISNNIATQHAIN